MTISNLRNLLPYTSGFSVALLVMGMIVNPVFAQSGGSACYICTNFWYSNCMDGTLPQCQGFPNTNMGQYQKMQMAWKLVSENCHFPTKLNMYGQVIETKPCPSSQSNPQSGYSCESEKCGQFTCNVNYTISPYFRPGSVCVELCRECELSKDCSLLQNKEAIDYSKKTGVILSSNCYGYCGCGSP